MVIWLQWTDLWRRRDFLRGAQALVGNKGQETLLNSGVVVHLTRVFLFSVSLLLPHSGLPSAMGPLLSTCSCSYASCWLMVQRGFSPWTLAPLVTHAHHSLHSWTLIVSSEEGIYPAVFCLAFHILSAQYGRAKIESPTQYSTSLEMVQEVRTNLNVHHGRK